MKRLLFTHGADIDGMGNAILAKLAFENIDIIYARNVSDLETKFLNEYNAGNLYNYDIVYITDLSLKKEIADKVYSDDKLKDKLYIFDHHETALASGLNEYNNTNVHVELNGIKTCGTELYYNYLKDNGYLEDSTAISEFVEKVRKDYRNPASHKESIKMVTAAECLDYVINVQKKLKEMIVYMNH